MMQKISYIFFGFLLCLYSCKEEDRPPLLADYWGEASALKNGEDWKPHVIGISYPDDPIFGMFFQTYSHDGFLRESLSISKIPEGPGKYYLYWTSFRENDTTEAFYSTILDDGDVLGDVYDADNESLNFLEVKEYDTETREIKGTFEITLVLSRDNGHGSEPPDTLRFTNGIFHTRIKDSLSDG